MVVGNILTLGTKILLVTIYIIVVRWRRQKQLREMQDGAIERNFNAQFGDEISCSMSQLPSVAASFSGAKGNDLPLSV